MQSTALDYALYLCHGHCVGWKCSSSSVQGGEKQVVVLDEMETPDFEDQIRNYPQSAVKQITHTRVVLLSSRSGVFVGDLHRTLTLLQEHSAINVEDVELVASQLQSCYHSKAVKINDEMCLEICYNIRESLIYAAKTNTLDSSISIDSSGPMDVTVQHQREPLYFRYNLITGQTTYVLLDARRDLRELLAALGEKLANVPDPKLHPLALQAVILFNVLSARNPMIEALTKHLLRIEAQLRQGSIFEIAESEQFARYVQLLHNMSRELITLEHGNQRDSSNVDNLLRDHSRLWTLVKRHSNATRIDLCSHEQIRDSLFSLRDFCRDRARRILSLKQRTQGLIALLYNLITGHDSTTNLRIAAESAKIAHASKRDGTSMKIIAAMAMLYLPPTLVCSLFGTNLVALNTNGPEPSFVVSRLWWLYIVFTAPLMIITVLGFVIWRRWRGGPPKADEKLEV